MNPRKPITIKVVTDTHIHASTITREQLMDGMNPTSSHKLQALVAIAKAKQLSVAELARKAGLPLKPIKLQPPKGTGS